MLEDHRQATVETHPSYDNTYDYIIRVRECIEGSDKIKAKGTDYLPKTSGMETGSGGETAYTAYKTRAEWPSFTDDTFSGALGVLASNPPLLDVPDPVSELRDAAGPLGMDAFELLGDIHAGQLRDGRIGLLVDIPERDDRVVPWVLQYNSLAIVNWGFVGLGDPFQPRNGLRFVLLDESNEALQPDGSHAWVEEYRLCALDRAGLYFTQSLTPDQLNEIDLTDPEPLSGLGNPYPEFRGRAIDFIPFVSVRVMDLGLTPVRPPLLPVADACISVYRGSADYRQALFMQGQATPYGVGVAQDERVDLLGANSMIWCTNPEAELGFMEVGGEGLEEMRIAQENGKALAAQKGARLLDTSGNSYESGKALSIRVNTQTSTLKVIATTGAAGLRQAFGYAYYWVTGSDDWDTLRVVPKVNFDMSDVDSATRSMQELAEAAEKGAPIRKEDMWKYAQTKGIVPHALAWADVESEFADMEVAAAGVDEDKDTPPTGKARDGEFSEGDVVEIAGAMYRYQNGDFKGI